MVHTCSCCSLVPRPFIKKMNSFSTRLVAVVAIKDSTVSSLASMVSLSSLFENLGMRSYLLYVCSQDFIPLPPSLHHRVIFTNNFAFGPKLNHELKLRFANVSDGKSCG